MDFLTVGVCKRPWIRCGLWDPAVFLFIAFSWTAADTQDTEMCNVGLLCTWPLSCDSECSCAPSILSLKSVYDSCASKQHHYCHSFLSRQEKLELFNCILALPGPNSTTVRGPGKRAFKIASQSLWPGFASANQLSVWNASPQLLIHDHLPFSSSVVLKGRVQNSRSWRSQVKSTNQIMRNQGNTCRTRGHHNQASQIFNMIGCW